MVNVGNATGREKSEGAALMYIWGPVYGHHGLAGRAVVFKTSTCYCVIYYSSHTIG